MFWIFRVIEPSIFLDGHGVRQVMAEDDGCRSGDCSFEWDEQTQLYFHASSGFYHDPNAGWYYSSRDGLYYRFDDGNYVLWDSEKGDESKMEVPEATVTEKCLQEEPCDSSYSKSENQSSFPMDVSGVDECLRNVSDETAIDGLTEHTGDQGHETLRPTSEWLEDMLIDLYLAGHNQVGNAAADATFSSEADDREDFKLSTNVNDDAEELEEGEWIPDPEDYHGFADSSEGVSNEDGAWEEEIWRAQYGQVTRSKEETEPEFPVVDLWDWSMVTVPRKDGKRVVSRLTGRLVKQSAKLHPSMPSGGRLLKTAPICEVRRDLVRVTTGQVYKLRNPSGRYLASLSSYESSDPTKDWGFPEISVKGKVPLKCQNIEPKTGGGVDGVNHSSILPDQHYAPSKHTTQAYRDRAAERRKLHGGFGIGPGQKKTGRAGDDDDDDGDDHPTCAEDAAAEALNMSFGAGSYARKIMEGMGWKEGEALGSTRKGLKQPLQAVGNTGNAGVGWPRSSRRSRG